MIGSSKGKVHMQFGSNNTPQKKPPSMQEQQFNDDYFLEVIKSKGFGYGKKDLGQVQLLNVRNLSFYVEELLFQYVDSQSEEIFPLFVINLLLQRHSDLTIVERELLNIWNSVQQLKDQEIIVKIYQSFLSNQFRISNIHFFVKTSKVILQNIIGDRYHDNPQLQDLSQIYMPSEKLGELVAKLFIPGNFQTDILQQVNQTQIVFNLFNNLKVTLQEHRSMINCQDFQVQCLMEFRSIEHKSYVQQMQNYTKNILQGRRSTFVGHPPKGINPKKFLQQQPTFYDFHKILGPKDLDLQMQQKKVNKVVENSMKQKVLNGTQSAPKQDQNEYQSLIEGMINTKNRGKRQLVNTPLLKKKDNDNANKSINDQTILNNIGAIKQYDTNKQTNTLNDTTQINHLPPPSKQQPKDNTYAQYQIKKMYNQEEVKNLQSPDTKIKELQLKMKETEKERQDFKREQNKLINEITELRHFKEQAASNNDKVSASQITGILRFIQADVQSVIEENIKMKEGSGQSSQQTKERKRKITNAFDQLYGLLQNSNGLITNSSSQKPQDNTLGDSQELPTAKLRKMVTSYDFNNKLSPQLRVKKAGVISGHSSIEQSSASLVFPQSQTQVHQVNQSPVQPDSFTKLLLNFQVKPIAIENKMNQYLKMRISQMAPELPPRDEEEDEEDAVESSNTSDVIDREELRDQVVSKENLQKLQKQNQSNRNYTMSPQEEISLETFKKLTYNDDDDGLISDIGSENESILERSIRGNLKLLLQTSMASSVNSYDLNFEKGANKIPLPKALPSNLKVNEEFLKQFSNPATFQIFRVIEDFRAEEKRHLTCSKSTVFVGLREFNSNWMFGCKENDPRAFGFIPMNYLEFNKETGKVQKQL